MKHMFAPVLAACMACSAAMADPTAITATLTDIAAGADRHDWERVRNAFAPTVTADYTSLWGGMAAPQPADELVAAWAGFLPGFDSTHHMVTNHTVTMVDAARATAEADFTATHRIGDDLWVLGGRYSYELEASQQRWVVSKLVMTALWETGDRGLVAQAAERAASTE